MIIHIRNVTWATICNKTQMFSIASISKMYLACFLTSIEKHKVLSTIGPPLYPILIEVTELIHCVPSSKAILMKSLIYFSVHFHKTHFVITD